MDQLARAYLKQALIARTDLPTYATMATHDSHSHVASSRPLEPPAVFPRAATMEGRRVHAHPEAFMRPESQETQASLLRCHGATSMRDVGDEVASIVQLTGAGGWCCQKTSTQQVYAAIVAGRGKGNRH